MKLTYILTSILSVVLISCGDINVTDPDVEVNNGGGDSEEKTAAAETGDEAEEMEQEEIEVAETETEPEPEEEPFKLETKIKKGMTKQEILDLLGEPDEIIQFYKATRWYWNEEGNENKFCTENFYYAADRCYLSFLDSDGTLDSQEGFKTENLDITSF